MSSATVKTEDGWTTLTFHLQMQHDAARVWRALSEPAELSRWWPMPIEELRLEAGASLRFSDGEGGESEGTVLEVQVGKVLAFEEEAGAHRVRFEVLDAPPRSRLRFTHRFPASEPADRHEFGWNLVFSDLFDHLRQG
jgi:uncharacterized protein YndB with AHSA1/START domain